MFYVLLFFIFFFNDPATTEIYTLSLHDALPIYYILLQHLLLLLVHMFLFDFETDSESDFESDLESQDRKSTRLNSSHTVISYAVFCLKKKKKKQKQHEIFNNIQR